ncbi:MAG: metal ABC transporter ATP-binding protein [Rhodoglobus sp.]
MDDREPQRHDLSASTLDTPAVLQIRRAQLALGGRTLWSGLDLTVMPGEFVAVLGGNGSGKTSLLRSILGQLPLDSGEILLQGHPARRGDRRIGYIPQQRIMPVGTALRGRDLITLGLDGHRWGVPWPSRRTRERVDQLVEAVGAADYADLPVGILSGGEQQRLRVAQALASDPALLLCDEPLSSLDLQHQRGVAELIDSGLHERGTAVIFVTHDINPVLDMVDTVLYLAEGSFTAGPPEEVLRSEVLSALYGTPVEVLTSNGRIFVAGIPEFSHHPEEAG